MRNLGLTPARLHEVEAFVAAVRDLVNEGRTTYDGRECVLPWAPDVAPGGVPVWMAANGPRSLHLAGRIADGVIVGGGVTPEIVELSLDRLEQGCKAVGRTLADLEVWFQADVLVTDDDDPVAGMKDILASIGSRNFRGTLEDKAVPARLADAIRTFEAKYHYEEHISEGGHNGRLLDELGLTDFFAERWLVSGSAGEVVERLEVIEASGVERLHLPALVPDRHELVRRLRADVLPHLT